MRRIRIVVLLLAVALLVPTALLVRRTLQGVAAEKAARHRTVAERVFDEMERSLSGFLAAEEARPSSAYRFEPGSPLLAAPAEPFVVGWFEIGADGRVRTAPAESERVAAAVNRYLAARRDERALPTAEAETQAPGTTVMRLDQLRALGYATAADDLEQKEEDVPPPSKSARTYQVLQSLNIGARERAARERKLEPERRLAHRSTRSSIARAGSPATPQLESVTPQLLEATAAELRDADAGAGAIAADEPVQEGFAQARRPLETAGSDRPAEERQIMFERGLTSSGRADARARRAPERRASRTQVAVDPLHGLVVDADHLLLSRTVWSGESGIRQGLVLDRPGLASWLRERIFAPLSLPGAVLSFVGESDPSPAAASAYVYRHRFAEPFQGATAVLALAPLAEVSGEGTVYALASLLVLVGAAGLFAIYRTVAVTVGFAERRSNFVAAVTHELKTPLTAIRMYGEMLRDGIVPDESKRQEYYRTITAESERLSRLINNVLEFSRLERGTREMHLVSGDLGSVVTEMAELVRSHAEAEGFALEVEIEPELPAVRFDRDALLQMLFNLVDNAVKYASASSDRRIRITCTAAPGEATGVLLRVRDHGPGVPGRHLSRVFEPFYRGEDELTRRTKGTGLGLALVKGLAERMGAAISGANASDGGFEVRIAFVPAPAR